MSFCVLEESSSKFLYIGIGVGLSVLLVLVAVIILFILRSKRSRWVSFRSIAKLKNWLWASYRVSEAHYCDSHLIHPAERNYRFFKELDNRIWVPTKNTSNLSATNKSMIESYYIDLNKFIFLFRYMKFYCVTCDI